VNEPADGAVKRHVVITGGASGIGLATAERFHRDGARVAIMDLPEKLSALTLHSEWLAVPADVADPSAVYEAYAKLDELNFTPDVLIANAGISVRKSVLEITPEEWERVISVNLNGVFYCAQAAARQMMRRGSGTILMTASTNGKVGHMHYAHYNASKAGVLLLMRTMARELAPIVRVNAVCPGYVWSPMQQAEYTEEMVAKVDEQIPAKRHATCSEVAGLFAFLASPEAAYMTGAEIPIDGGELA
jgi:meso-butanediol dehydrogenase / (S,S)-butanediol dehydrogenase / diacetyl reductase